MHTRNDDAEYEKGCISKHYEKEIKGVTLPAPHHNKLTERRHDPWPRCLSATSYLPVCDHSAAMSADELDIVPCVLQILKQCNDKVASYKKRLDASKGDDKAEEAIKKLTVRHEDEKQVRCIAAILVLSAPRTRSVAGCVCEAGRNEVE